MSGKKKEAGVLVASIDGTVVAQNPQARRLLGRGVGRKCWDLVRSSKGARDLPCADGCVTALAKRGMRAAKGTTVQLRGDELELCCVPVDGQVVCSFVPLARDDDAAGDPVLSPRERQVLRLLADGLTSAEIADELGLADATVRVHVERMRKKLGIKTRAGLVAHGFRTLLLRP